jgi:hypothetical protein
MLRHSSLYYSRAIHCGFPVHHRGEVAFCVPGKRPRRTRVRRTRPNPRHFQTVDRAGGQARCNPTSRAASSSARCENHYSENFGSASSQAANGTVFGLHGGLKLYEIQRDVDRGGYCLSPSEYVRKHIDPSSTALPDILIKSLDRDRLVLVLDDLIETWLMTGDLIHAAIECAKAADAAGRAASAGTPPQYMGRGIQFESRLQVLQNQLSLLGIE